VAQDLALALSPYFLATREVQAVAALVLGSRVVTLMPAPSSGRARSDVRRAVERAPRYLRLMDAWRWSGPLWRSGVISAGIGAEYCSDELEVVLGRIDHDESLASVRGLTRHIAEHRRASSREETAENEGDTGGVTPDRYLDALAGDLLKGGPDPGINIAITASVDQFALSHGLAVVRSGVDSVAQRAESKLGTRVFSIALPMLTRGSGRVIERLRGELRGELTALRLALGAVCDESLGESSRHVGLSSIDKFVSMFSGAFDEWAARNVPGDDEAGERLTVGYLNIAGMTLPADAVLLSGRAAVRSMRAGAGRMAAGSRGELRGGEVEGRLFALVIREMNVRPVV
jgi:hypothetical protein